MVSRVLEKMKRLNKTFQWRARPLPREIIIFLCFLGLTAVMSWPWILHLRDAVADSGDSYAISYWLWWDYHQTFHDPLNLFHANVFFPYHYTMAFTENDYGVSLLFFPLFALGFRPLTVHSLATFVAFAFSGYGMFRLVRTLTDSNGAAWIAGLIFAFLPYRFQRLPHLHLIFSGWIPLLLEALVLFARQRSWRRAVWLAVTFVMNAITCVTWFILTLVPFSLSAVFLLVWWRLGRDRAFWIRGGVALGAAALVLLCFLLPYYRVHEMYGFARSVGDATGLSAYPIHWLAASPRNKLWEGLGGSAAIDELTLFPGFLPPLLALAACFLVKPGLRQYRSLSLQKLKLNFPLRKLLLILDVLAILLLLAALLTIGYGSIHLRLFGVELFRASSPTRLLVFFFLTLCLRWFLAYPEIIHRVFKEKNFVRNIRLNPRSATFGLGVIWALIGFLGSFGMHLFFHQVLYELVPLFRSMRSPARWAMICYVGLSLLAGLGAAQLIELFARWRPGMPRKPLYAVLAILILFEQRVAPVEFIKGEVDPDAITIRLKETPMAGGIVEFPAEKNNYAYFRYMLRAADHGRPIVTASSSFAPRIILELESLTKARPIPDRLLDLLEEIPTSYLVVHNSMLTLESRHAIEIALARGMAAGRIKFINSFGDSTKRDDLYAITKVEPKAQSEAPLPMPVSPIQVEDISSTQGGSSPASPSGPNPIEDIRFFARQQYLDLLNREPEPSGLDNLAASMDACKGEPNCLMEQHILGALGVLRSQEFRDTSYFVYRLYQMAFGRTPSYLEWAQDMNRLRANNAEPKLAFAGEWIARPQFLDQYPEGMANDEYVAKLLQLSGYRPTNAEREALVDSLNNGSLTRAEVLINVTGNAPVAEREFNQALITLCYFSYLKRDPDPEGFKYWSQALSRNSNNTAAVVKGFIYSGEYRARFGQP